MPVETHVCLSMNFDFELSLGNPRYNVCKHGRLFFELLYCVRTPCCSGYSHVIGGTEPALRDLLFHSLFEDGARKYGSQDFIYDKERSLRVSWQVCAMLAWCEAAQRERCCPIVYCSPTFARVFYPVFHAESSSLVCVPYINAAR